MQQNRMIQISKLSQFQAAEPLWKRVPVYDEYNRPLSDFIMLISKLSSKPNTEITTIVNDIDQILQYHKKYVVFADLNMRINVLWVSVKSVPGICTQIAAAIHCKIPSAKLVAHGAL